MVKDKEYKFTITFRNEKDRDDFRDKITSHKIKTGIPIYQIATMMLESFMQTK